MIQNPMDVLNLFPIRKNKKQKQAFRDAVQTYADGLGYPASVEKGSLGAKNVVIGNPNTAKYLVTAHYDTPAALIIPNLITPCNPVTFLLYQILIVLVFLLASVIPGVALGVVLDSPELASTAAMVLYWGLLVMMFLGPANKHNANDNRILKNSQGSFFHASLVAVGRSCLQQYNGIDIVQRHTSKYHHSAHCSRSVNILDQGNTHNCRAASVTCLHEFSLFRRILDKYPGKAPDAPEYHGCSQGTEQKELKVK